MAVMRVTVSGESMIRTVRPSAGLMLLMDSGTRATPKPAPAHWRHVLASSLRQKILGAAPIFWNAMDMIASKRR